MVRELSALFVSLIDRVKIEDHDKVRMVSKDLLDLVELKAKDIYASNAEVLPLLEEISALVKPLQDGTIFERDMSLGQLREIKKRYREIESILKAQEFGFDI